MTDGKGLTEVTYRGQRDYAQAQNLSKRQETNNLNVAPTQCPSPDPHVNDCHRLPRPLIVLLLPLLLALLLIPDGLRHFLIKRTTHEYFGLPAHSLSLTNKSNSWHTTPRRLPIIVKYVLTVRDYPGCIIRSRGLALDVKKALGRPFRAHLRLFQGTHELADSELTSHSQIIRIAAFPLV